MTAALEGQTEDIKAHAVREVSQSAADESVAREREGEREKCIKQLILVPFTSLAARPQLLPLAIGTRRHLYANLTATNR